MDSQKVIREYTYVIRIKIIMLESLYLYRATTKCIFLINSLDLNVIRRQTTFPVKSRR